MKSFNVFNLTQAEEIPAELIPQIVEEDNRQPIEKAEQILTSFQNSKSAVPIHHGCSLSEKGKVRACYAVARDEITIPERKLFNSLEEYYSTVFHEIVHSTGHESRLNRTFDNRELSPKAYAFEELTAEIGSAYLLARCGLSPATLQSSAAYISTWLRIFKGDSSMVVKASAAASRAVGLVVG